MNFHLVEDQSPPPGWRKARLELRADNGTVLDGETFVYHSVGRDLGKKMDEAMAAIQQRRRARTL